MLKQAFTPAGSIVFEFPYTTEVAPIFGIIGLQIVLERGDVRLEAVAHGSTCARRRLNLPGEYDFSDEKLRDSVGSQLQKLDP